MSTPVLFLSHGSPMRVLEASPASQFLKHLGRELPTPQAILVVSAHWETQGVQFTQQSSLDTIYDFYGFPEALSQIRYPAKCPAPLQQQLLRLSDASDSDDMLAGLVGANRGLDHGAWSVLHLLYPQAQIPVIGLSLPLNASLQQLYRLGQQLAPLRDDGVLIICSGMATHNLAALKRVNTEQPESPSQWASEFMDWLKPKVLQHDLAQLVKYRELAPSAQQAHPRDEHLRPLFIAMGAGDNHGQPRPELIHESWELQNGNNASWMWL